MKSQKLFPSDILSARDGNTVTKLANSVHLDEGAQYEMLHQDPHCLPSSL